jgi:glutamate transport system permease protein
MDRAPGGGAAVTATPNRILFDDPGPRARRRILIATVVSLLAIAVVIYLAVSTFADNGQLAAAKWSIFTTPLVRTFLWEGFVNTMKLTVVSGVLALPLGVLFALLRLAHNRALRWLGTAYVEIFRSVPLLLLVLMFVLALPPLGINLPIFWKICVPIVMCNAAILAEIFRAGVNALPRGQLEASLAIGLTYWQAMRLVIFPQAIRLIIPALITQLVSLLKDSTLGYAASFPELLRTANVLTARTHTLIQVYIVISLIYVVINVLLSYLARVLERRLNRTRVSSAGRGEGFLEEAEVGGVLPMETAPGGAIMR